MPYCVAPLDTSNWSGPAKSMKKFYNVALAVGQGSYNRPLDVKLVQYFLKKVVGSPTWAHSRPSSNLAVDGWFGPITKEWILSFQNGRTQTAPGSIAVDGRVDRAKGGAADQQVGTISGTAYTIIHLNTSFYIRYPQIHANPTLGVPDLPADLAVAMMSPFPA